AADAGADAASAAATALAASAGGATMVIEAGDESEAGEEGGVGVAQPAISSAGSSRVGSSEARRVGVAGRLDRPCGSGFVIGNRSSIVEGRPVPPRVRRKLRHASAPRSR